MAGDLTILVQIVLLIPSLMLVTFVATRVLGVRRSWLANTVSVALGISLGGLLARWVSDVDPGDPRFVRNMLAISFVMTMVAAVGADLLAKPGSLAAGDQAGLFVIPRPLSRARSAIDDARRTREIVQIVSRNGFGPTLGLHNRRQRREAAATRPTEERLRTTLEQCGGMFVKLGQMASTRSDVFPPNVIAVLAHLQSEVSPEPPAAMKQLLEEELGSSVEAVFAEFDWEPIAAASIGQVYRATLRTGEKVIVKAQRPNVSELVRRDTNVLLRLAATVEAKTPFGAEYHVRELAAEFCRGLAEELDFRTEARNTEIIRANMADEPGVRIARIYDEYSTARVMVQERLEGTDSAHSETLAELGYDREQLSDTLLRAALQQMMTDGFFHADLHPGNVLILEDGVIAMIDFGATGRLDPMMQEALRQMLIATALRDAAMLRQAVSAVTEIGDLDVDALERALAHFMSVYVAPGQSIGAGAISELMALLTTFGIQVPAELTTFSRALLILEGTLGTICPGYKFADHAQHIAEEWVQAAMAPGSSDDLIKAELMAQLPTLRLLPRKTERVLDQLEHGNLTMKVSLFSTPSDVAFMTKMANRFILGLLGALLGIISVMLLSTNAGPVLADGVELLHILGAIGLAAGVILILRVVAAIARDGLN